VFRDVDQVQGRFELLLHPGPFLDIPCEYSISSSVMAQMPTSAVARLLSRLGVAQRGLEDLP
jgi:hypothetical protein